MEIDKFNDEQIKTLLNTILILTENYPNDQVLGNKVRKIVSTMSDKIKK